MVPRGVYRVKRVVPLGQTPLASATPGRQWPAITLESLLYLVILGLALLSRFWDLGSRALHHDESLHAYFSWLLATGQNYTHDPLMHGPFLFHFNALIYALFGASDATTRFSSAIFGVILVMQPIMLRGDRHLGRWGALTASTLLLISPVFLYQSRYIRHDSFTVVGALLLFTAIVRYVEKPSRGWLITMGATIGFLVTNHEIVFGLVAIFLGALAGALLWGPLRRLIPLAIVSGAAALALLVVVPKRTRPLPEIPWQSPSQQQQFDYYRELLTHPLIVLLAILAVVTIAAALLIIQLRRDPDRVQEGWAPLLFGDPQPGSVAAGWRAAWHDATGISWGVIAGLVIFATLFTTLFTNLYGLATGTIATDGTLLYWLAQHDVRRGEQPWFYYLLLMPQYEYIAVLFGSAAAFLAGGQALLVGIGRRQPGPRFFFQTLLAIWFAGIFFALSWAGEKMPWLVMHISLPATLLAASLLGKAWRRWRPARLDGTRVLLVPGWRAPQWMHLTALLVLAGSWFLIAAPLTYGVYPIPGGQRELTAWGLSHWWLLALPPLAALIMLILAYLRQGPRLTAQAALVALLLVLGAAQVHSAWRLVYQEGDIPRDMLVYTQTSPDIHRMVGELTTLSEEMTGGKDLVIWYDEGNGVSWPMQWYLRDFPNRNIFGRALSGPPDNVPILLVASDNLSAVEPYMDGYTAQKYVLRWWFPESLYRNFAIAPEVPPSQSALKSSDNPKDFKATARSIWTSVSALGTPEGQQHLYRLMMYHELPTPIGAYTYTLYIRNDLLPLYNEIRY